MDLHHVLETKEAYIHMERFVNQRNYSKFCNYSEVGERYGPKAEAAFFELPCFLVPRDDVVVYLDDPSEPLENTYTEGLVPFRVHPDVPEEEMCQFSAYERGESILVTPMACTRTVLTIDEAENHFIKLHLPKRISRFNRRLRRSSVKHSINVSHDLQTVDFEKFAYLPESIGVVYGNGEYGFLIRETRPRPHVMQQRWIIPYFSLYSIDEKSQDHRPLLVQMIGELGVKPADFIRDEILAPVIKCWCAVLDKKGLLLESHAQNTLLEIGEDLRPKRIVHRDFQSVMVDPEIRHAQDFPFDKHVIGKDAFFERAQEYSLVYDFLMGHHMFESVLNVLSQYYGIKTEDIRQSCKEVFNMCVPYKYLFPPTEFHFTDESFPDNIPKLEDTHLKPAWR